VTYYWKPLAILTALCVSMALADDFKTIKGKEYKNATVTRVDADGIVVRTKGGISKLYFGELPDDVQARFGHDPAKIEAEGAAARAAEEKRIEEQRAAERQRAETEKNAESASKRGLNAEQWVVAQATAGEIANLEKEFHEEKDRKLSAHFLEELLTGTLPGFKPHRNGVRIMNAIIDEPIDLRNGEIPSEVRLEHCQFNSGLTFASARFAQSVSFEDSTFNEDTNFNSVKVGGEATFTKVVFGCRVNFEGADIASQFSADGARFNEATFGVMKVGGSAFFNDAVFEGPVIFNWASITGSFVANEAKFLSTEEIASFHNTKVRGNAVFSNAVFAGPTDFSLADIGSQFVAGGVQFQNKEQLTNFNSMKVRGHTFFNNAVFQGPVNFVLSEIASNFEADRAKFQNKEKEADFHGMKVGGRAFFSDAVFKGPVDFSYSDFAWLDLSSRFGPKAAAQFHMQGMTYKYIRAVSNNEPESHKALLKLAEQSAYTADVYSNLEAFFLSQGYRPDADKAFIAGKRREREEYVRSGHWFRWLGSWMLDLLVGYGRRPWQAGIPCAALIALGCVLFSPKKMEPRNPAEAPRVYSRFWYSLGLFLPFVDLQADKVWKPKADETFLRNYMRVHILLGWILVPLVLAALTGLIK
jgi:hypothetical protein